MTQVVGEHQPAIIVTNASVLINFLRIDRTDLLTGHSHAFLATDHVAAEITDRYPDQQQRFAAALAAGTISETRVTTPVEIRLFGSLFAAGRLGACECSAVALAVHRRYILAIDDRLATTQARRSDTTLRILPTQDLIVSMIRQGLLDIAEADRFKQEWATRHRFRLKLTSFRDLLEQLSMPTVIQAQTLIEVHSSDVGKIALQLTP